MIGMELHILQLSNTFSTTNSVGCDSTATLNLTIVNQRHQLQMLRHVIVMNGIVLFLSKCIYTYTTTNSVM